MKAKLRHPILAIREPFGTAGLIVAIIALVLALTGAAFAAAGLNGKQKKEVEKIAKKFAGKPGANGAPGAQGLAGANGKEGAAGKQGEAGTNGVDGVSAEAISFTGVKTIGSVTCSEGGIEVKSAKPTVLVCNGEEGSAGTNGTNGNNGASAKATSFSGSAHGCVEGGIEVTSAEPTAYVCNGSPWTAGGTLPSGSTETGAWAVSEDRTGGAGALVKTSLSFPIPLAAGMTGSANVTFELAGYTGTEEQCPGTVSAPKAKAGHVCVYAAELKGSFTETPAIVPPSVAIENIEQFLGAENSVGTSGAMIAILAGEEEVSASGSWAVTAP